MNIKLNETNTFESKDRIIGIPKIQEEIKAEIITTSDLFLQNGDADKETNNVKSKRN
jgi:hypothetical protein